jgi:hypothetical protein
VLLEAAVRVHEPADPNVPEPPEKRLNEIDPPGLLFVPDAVSVTVAVQVVTWSTAREEGVQETLVAVDRSVLKVTATLFVPLPVLNVHVVVALTQSPEKPPNVEPKAALAVSVVEVPFGMPLIVQAAVHEEGEPWLLPIDPPPPPGNVSLMFASWAT